MAEIDGPPTSTVRKRLEDAREADLKLAAKSPAPQPLEQPEQQKSEKEESPVPKRIDPTDGKEYTREQFFAFYGTSDAWNRAKPAGGIAEKRWQDASASSKAARAKVGSCLLPRMPG